MEGKCKEADGAFLTQRFYGATEFSLKHSQGEERLSAQPPIVHLSNEIFVLRGSFM